METEARDLRTGKTVWEARPLLSLPVQPLIKDIKTDVLIVGAGTSGAFMAEALTDAGLDVAVVDRRGPAEGATTASTALIEYEIDTPIIELAKKIGLAKAERAWKRSHLALTSLAARTRALGIDCAQTRRDNLYLAGNMLDAKGLEREWAARRAIGIETVLLSRKDVKERFGISRQAALLSFDDLSCDPRQLAVGYLDVAAKRGARLFSPVTVMDVKGSGKQLTVKTQEGPRILCRHIVFCTGYELPDHVPKRGHSIISTYAIATRQQRDNLWPGECFIWEASDPYLYIRTSPEGRVICGGEDEEFEDEAKRDARLDRKTAVLERKLKKLLPDLDTKAEFAWTGSFGTTATGLPTVDQIPKYPHRWFVLGFGGNGITYSRLGADIVRAALTGKRDPDADLYALGGPARTR
ncbi:FAD-dependent oxidoreductase [Terrihabitans soli]|uniref:FAD-dependent oxidoreductase n=1 Tax=Terrihabitans soli TaxID=708113 RepID=A0A6S6QV05_9HYPH|nr:FAD-binding oxidoreductase [Terrihabitans soli]BCJ90338.1 FAD-dependent oxidoreductase [Terrihabitans soli]